MVSKDLHKSEQRKNFLGLLGVKSRQGSIVDSPQPKASEKFALRQG